MFVSSDVIARAPSLDALKIYAWLLTRFNGGSGSIASTSYEALTRSLDERDLRTERGAAFTVAVVRKRLAQLETVGAVILEKLKGAAFALTFRPFEPKEEPDETEPRVDHYGGRTLFDSLSETITETTPKQKSAPQEEYININKQTNKQSARSVAIQADDEVDDRPTVDEARAKVDETTDAFKGFRAKVAAVLREPTLRSELVDRIAVAVASGFLTPIDALALCRSAVDARDLWKRSDGRRGVQWAWRDITPHIIKIFDFNGYKWTPTRGRFEPEARRVPNVRKFRLVDNSGREIEDDE